MSITRPIARPITQPIARALTAPGVGGGRIPQPGDYLLTAFPPTGDYLTDESGNRLTA